MVEEDNKLEHLNEVGNKCFYGKIINDFISSNLNLFWYLTISA